MNEIQKVEKFETTGAIEYRKSTDAAGLCREIVLRTALKIQGRRYVRIEGWQALATAHGCVCGIESVSADAEGNVAAVAVVKRIDDGQVVSRAEGFVGVDEKAWQTRPMYARRAMAQTRAMSRAARSAFAHVVVLIDAGLSTTPAEEMSGDDPDLAPPPAPPPRRPAPNAAVAEVEPPPVDNLAEEAAESEFRQVFEEAAVDRGAAPANARRLLPELLRRARAAEPSMPPADVRARILANLRSGKYDAWLASR